jgi:hypothetical protein
MGTGMVVLQTAWVDGWGLMGGAVGVGGWF